MEQIWADEVSTTWADRFKSKFMRRMVLAGSIVTSDAIYREYLMRTKPEGKRVFPTGKDFTRAVYDVNQEVWKEIIETLWVCTLPHNLGRQFVVELKPKDPEKDGTYIHWPDTRKAGKIVRRYNLKTNGRRFSLRLKTRSERLIANRDLYHFRFMKPVKSMLNSKIVDNPEYRALPDY